MEHLFCYRYGSPQATRSRRKSWLCWTTTSDSTPVCIYVNECIYIYREREREAFEFWGLYTLDLGQHISNMYVLASVVLKQNWFIRLLESGAQNPASGLICCVDFESEVENAESRYTEVKTKRHPWTLRNFIFELLHKHVFLPSKCWPSPPRGLVVILPEIYLIGFCTI